jgi:mannose-6-phosphate isomerase-like protein (cupin superfamily)
VTIALGMQLAYPEWVMSYTIKNLQEVEDSAPKFGFGSKQEARFARKDLDAERTGLSFHRVLSGQQQGFAHRHEKAEEIYVVLGGTGRIKLDDDVHDIKPLDAIRVAPDVARAFEADDDGPLEILAFGPHEPEDRGEMLTEGFWNAD